MRTPSTEPVAKGRATKTPSTEDLSHVWLTPTGEQAAQPVSVPWPIGHEMATGREIRPANQRSHSWCRVSPPVTCRSSVTC